MKKIFFIPALLLIFVTFNSCQKDDSLDPRPVIVSGNFVRLDIVRPRLSIDESSSTFGGTLTNPGGLAVKYNLYVRRTDPYGTTFDDFHLIKTVTSFPLELALTASDIATALGVDVSTLQLGDHYRFYGESFDAAGNRTDYYNLSSAIINSLASYKEAYRFQGDMTDSAGLSDLTNLDPYAPQ